MQEINDLLSKCGSSAFYSNGYGMTEACSALAVNANAKDKKESVGIPWLDTNVKIIEVETGNELKYGDVGELWFNSPSLMMNYYKDQEATEKILVNDDQGRKWLRTGDLGTVDEDGFEYIKGRLKRIYITRSENNVVCKLFPQHVEDKMLNLDYVEKCGVVVCEDEEKMNVPIAFIELSEAARETSQEEIKERILQYAKRELPEYMVPVEIRILDKMPMTLSGKIDYRPLESIS